MGGTAGRLARLAGWFVELCGMTGMVGKLVGWLVWLYGSAGMLARLDARHIWYGWQAGRLAPLVVRLGLYNWWAGSSSCMVQLEWLPLLGVLMIYVASRQWLWHARAIFLLLNRHLTLKWRPLMILVDFRGSVSPAW